MKSKSNLKIGSGASGTCDGEVCREVARTRLQTAWLVSHHYMCS